MPRGDRTGPLGAGPLTGRGAGWCANPAPRSGLGLGFRGGGRGWRNMFYATGLPGWARAGAVPPVAAAEQELADLKAQAGWLAGQLDAIQQRIEDFEGRGASEAAS